MKRTEVVTITNMCMVYRENMVLVQARVNKNWPGITFPGGHVEKGESLTDAVIREVWEETGLTIRSPQLCGVKDWMDEDGSRYMVLFYKTDKFEGTVKSSEEGEVYWVELEQLSKMPLANDMDGMLKIFLDDSLSEFYYFQKDGRWAYELK